MSTFQLSEPTAFPGLNQIEGHEAGFERGTIELKTLKYKHFRAVLKYPEEDQMHQLMLSMTGMTEDDIGELCPTDAAKISHLIFQSMKSYMELGQQILKGMQKE